MNNDILATKLAGIEGLAIGMQERLDDGNDITPSQTATLLERAKAIHSHVTQETPDAR